MTHLPSAERHGAGAPALRVPAATVALEPVTFEVLRGDETGPGADSLRLGVMDVRLEVFVLEQAVPFVQEIDARDFESTTLHVLARGADSTPLGAGRLLTDPAHPGHAHLGRLAVRRLARGTGLGARLVAALEAAAIEHAEHAGRAAGAAQAADPLEDPEAGEDGAPSGPRSVTVILSAQEQAMGFYERCGYRVVDARRYLDAGIWHRDMARTVPAPRGAVGAGAARG
ncbi:GNAT family N-acetyltransferase [Actinomyces howellii]|uniref:Uncharacterized N-acetyltransferase YjcF n=1 Tax=Actinomyces howellii TaxID=52771 RepID=A0A448HF16_9ACTO|nr:GNAT family N-acetyltransferase [Actinomyces howellii]VEG26822.1 Uncharacterized N-acetyltransferase YjcF [Actinomyces howellii]